MQAETVATVKVINNLDDVETVVDKTCQWFLLGRIRPAFERSDFYFLIKHI